MTKNIVIKSGKVGQRDKDKRFKKIYGTRSEEERTLLAVESRGKNRRQKFSALVMY